MICFAFLLPILRYTDTVQAGALERTLQEMVGANQGLSKSFKPVSERVAFDERAKLRAQLDKTYDRLKFKRGEERAIAGDIQHADGRLTMLADEQASLQNAVQALEQRRDEASAAVQVRPLRARALLLCRSMCVCDVCAHCHAQACGNWHQAHSLSLCTGSSSQAGAGGGARSAAAGIGRDKHSSGHPGGHAAGGDPLNDAGAQQAQL